MITTPHTHPCPHCHLDVAYPNALDGGCLFPSYREMTCVACAEALAPLDMQQTDFCFPEERDAP